MKISASVPDDLWTAAARDESSTSTVVQQALQLLKEHHEQSSDRLAAVEARYKQLTDVDNIDPADSLLQALVDQGRHLHQLGYKIGVDLCARLRVECLELLPADLADKFFLAAEKNRTYEPYDPAARDVIDWDVGDHLDLHVYWLVFDLLSEYEEGLLTNGVGETLGIVPSRLLFQGLASGVADVKATIADRVLRSGGFES